MESTKGPLLGAIKHELVNPQFLAAAAIGLVILAVFAVLGGKLVSKADVRHARMVEALDDYFEVNDCTVVTYTNTRLRHAETVLCLKGSTAGVVVPFEQVRQPLVKKVLGE
jgi:hypothetical protein